MIEQTQEMDLALQEQTEAAVQPRTSRFWQRLGMDATHRRFFLDALWLALALRGMLLVLAYLAGRLIEKSTDPLWPLIYKALSRWDTLNYYILV